MEDTMQVEEVMSFLGVSSDTVYYLIKTNRLKAKKDRPGIPGKAGRWAIERVSVESHAASIPICREPTIAEAAWSAGFMDGEACMVVHVSRFLHPTGTVSLSHVPNIMISSTDLEPLQWMRDLWGGDICPRRREKEQHNQQWCWRASSRLTRRILESTIPFLQIKRRQAELLLELVNHLEECRRHPRRVTPEIFAYRQSIKEAISLCNKRK